MTGFHTHHHTSLLTGLRTHRLSGLITAQHPESKPGLLSAQVDLHVLELRPCWRTKPFKCVALSENRGKDPEFTWRIHRINCPRLVRLLTAKDRKKNNERCKQIHNFLTNANISEGAADSDASAETRKSQRGSTSALMSLQNTSIIHTSQEVLAVVNVAVHYLQAEVGQRVTIRGFTPRHNLQNREMSPTIDKWLRMKNGIQLDSF